MTDIRHVCVNGLAGGVADVHAYAALTAAITRVDVMRDTLTPLQQPNNAVRSLTTGEARDLRAQLEAADKALRNAHVILANAIEALEVSP